MKHLISSDAYDLDETGYRLRMPLISGAASGLVMWLMSVAPFLASPPSLSWLISSSALFFGLGFIPGVAYGLVTVATRPKVAPSIEAIYTDTSGLAAPPPPERGFSYRVPCLWMKFTNFGVSGVLYIGKEGLLFMPHTHQHERNWWFDYDRPQLQKPLEVGPLDRISLNLAEARSDFFHRILHARMPHYIEIVWPGGRAQFAVPQAEQTKGKIERAISSLGGKYLGASRVEAEPIDKNEAGWVNRKGEVPIRSFDEEGLTPVERMMREDD